MVGVEGSEALVARALANADSNGLAGRCEFHAANLFETTEDSLAALGPLDKLLIDPPREGAIAVVKAISAQHGEPLQPICGALIRMSTSLATMSTQTVPEAMQSRTNSPPTARVASPTALT